MSIKHQDYYSWHPTGIECKAIAEHFNFNLGMAIKYIWRAGRKTDSSIEDLQKAIVCLEFEIEKIKKFDKDSLQGNQVNQVLTIGESGVK